MSFAAEIAAVPRDKLVFVDETGVNLAMTSTYARATEGQRAISRAPYNRGSNISVMAAIREDAVMTWRPVDGAVNGDRFLDFVQHDLARKLEKGDVVVLDNIKFHKSDAVREAVEAMGARVLFTPPYSPDMNAIEEVFSFAKSMLRRLRARNIPDLIDALRATFAAATSHLRSFVSHALKLAAQPL